MRYLILLAASLISFSSFAICSNENGMELVECDGGRVSAKEAKALQDSAHVLNEKLKWGEHAKFVINVSQTPFVEGTYGTMQICSSRTPSQCLPNKMSFGIERQPSFTKEFRMINFKANVLNRFAEALRDGNMALIITIHQKQPWYTQDVELVRAMADLPTLLTGKPLFADSKKTRFRLEFVTTP